MFRSIYPGVAGTACTVLVVSGFLLSGPTTAAENAAAYAAAETRLLDTVKFLASDELEGRGLDTKGIHTAADYIAKEFREIGLKTDLYDGSPFQKFELSVGATLGPKDQNTLRFVGSGDNQDKDGNDQVIALKLGDDFQTLTAGGSGTFDLPLVFVGYGITAKDKDYDDYAGVDVKGKAVVVLRHEPQQNNRHSKFAGTKPSRHALFRTKIANASEHGAAAIIFCTSDADVRRSVERIRKNKSLMAKLHKQVDLPLAQKEGSHERPDPAARRDATATALTAAVHRAADPVLATHRAGPGSSGRSVPVVHCRRETIDRMLQATIGKKLATIEDEIDKDLKPQSHAITGWKATGETSVARNKIVAKNVVAVLEATGPLADETIVIGAHYDHLGYGGKGSLARGSHGGAAAKKVIHNGADDNSSGVAALLETARRLVAKKGKLKRRIVFIAFTGEESGLLGSARYVKDPLFPLEKTVAMLNFDMVGRMKDDKLIIIGTGSASEFDSLVDRLTKDRGFKLAKHPSGFGPSDQTSFYAKQIPVMHFFTGTHRDYHRPTDDVEKVNSRGMRRVVDLVQEIALELSTTEKRPTYRESKSPRSIAKAGSRPYFGSIPDFSDDVKGYAISGVASGGPAAKAGLKGGDAIVQFGKSRIGNLDDFDNALRKYKSGDQVKLTVLRDGKKVELEVTLDPPR